MKAFSSSSAMPIRLSSKPGIIRSLPITSGSRSEAAPSTGSPSSVPSNPMTAKSPFCAGRPSTGTRLACLIAQLLDHLVDLGVVGLLHLRLEGEVGVVAELDRRANRQGDRVAGAVGLAEAGPLRLAGQLQRVDVLLPERLDDGALVEVLAGVVVDRVRLVGRAALDPERALEHGAGRLARAEAGHAGTASEVAHGLIDGAGDTFRRQLDFQHDAAAVGRTGGDLHGEREV